MEPRDYCAERSEHDGEPLEGTADRVTAWVMLEHAPAWSARPLDDGSLPPASAERLGAIASVLKSAGFLPRLQLVRQPGRDPGQRALFLHFGAALYRFANADVDVAGLIERPADFASHREEKQHYFVCTNGQRDLCCARFGLPVYATLSARVGERAWQTTHVGGHRFAPNVLVLPAGALYGRVTPARLPAFVDATERGELVHELLRGRSWRDPAVQAAEAYLLREQGRCPDGPAEVVSNGEAVTVHFPDDRIRVRLRTVTRDRFASCGDTKPKPTREFELVQCVAAVS